MQGSPLTDRTDRIALLTYLIMNTGNDLLTSVDTGVIPTIKDFEEVTRPYTGELKNPKSWGILQDMFKARQYMEAIEYEGWGKLSMFLIEPLLIIGCRPRNNRSDGC